MKKKLYIIVVLVALALLLLWLWLRREQPAIAASQTNTPSQVMLGATGPMITTEDLAKTPWQGTEDYKRSRIAEVRDVIKGANQPISFYGKVVDQDGIPLPGVKVRLNIKHTQEPLPGASRDVIKYLNLTTDDQGLFGVGNDKGSLLMVESLTKAGYEAPYVGNRPFWYAPPMANMIYTSDRQKPEIFRMWKLAGAEPLLRKGIGVGIPYDGSTVIFNLQSGREVKSGGDVKVTLLRTPLQIKRGQEKYDWTATIEAVDGGVIASSDEFMYRAPESGYESKITITTSAKDAKWSASKSVSFYLKSRGSYARVTADFTTDYDKPKTGFRITAFINPSGSRNLEYDPTQNIIKDPPPRTRTATPTP